MYRCTKFDPFFVKVKGSKSGDVEVEDQSLIAFMSSHYYPVLIASRLIGIFFFLSLVVSRNAEGNTEATREAEKWVLNNKDSFLKDFKELLSFPSISSHPERRKDVERAGDWVADKMKEVGLENVQFLEKGQ